MERWQWLQQVINSVIYSLECIELTDLLNQEIYKNNENRMKNRDSLNDIIVIKK
jgi:hypothetical protein